MNVSALTSSGSPAAALLAQQFSASSRDAASASNASGTNTSSSTKGTINDAAGIKKAASQFEAIILRQLLAPSIEPIMSGGMGAKSSSDSSGGIYGYMLTDTMADSLSKGGGLGLAKMLETQFSQRPASSNITTSAALKLKSPASSHP